MEIFRSRERENEKIISVRARLMDMIINNECNINNSTRISRSLATGLVASIIITSDNYISRGIRDNAKYSHDNTYETSFAKSR